MMQRWMGVVGGLLVVAACARTQEARTAESASTAGTTATATASGGATAAVAGCTPSPRMPLEGRASPYDSTTVSLGGATAKVCYGRPSAKGRTIFGGLVPYDQLWRTGANEPTIIHLPVAARIAGVSVAPGSYSLYTIPGRQQWTVIVNRSTSQWGHESQYTAEVQAQEVGRGTVASQRTDAPVETFTIRAEPAGGGNALVLEWENTRVRIPIERG